MRRVYKRREVAALARSAYNRARNKWRSMFMDARPVSWSHLNDGLRSQWLNATEHIMLAMGAEVRDDA